MIRTYTVIAVSLNTNSFGLKSIIMFAPSGHGLEVYQSPYGSRDMPAEGQELTLDRNNLSGLGYECPRTLPKITKARAQKFIDEVKAEAELNLPARLPLDA